MGFSKKRYFKTRTLTVSIDFRRLKHVLANRA